MNEFYSIPENNKELVNEYQIRDLGEKRISMILGSSSNRGRESSSSKIYKKVTTEDYDIQFARKLTTFKPPYDLEKVLDYHLSYYVNSGNQKEKFIKHIKYVIIPIVEKRKQNKIYIELITNWINHKMGEKKEETGNIILKTGDINSPLQVQINSDNSTQSQTIKYSNEDIFKLFEFLKNDLHKIENDLREDLQTEIENASKQLDKGNDIKNRLLTIGGLMKDVGIGVFTNLIASPIYQMVKPHLGL